MTQMYRVRKRRALLDKRGNIVGVPGDLFPLDDPRCKDQLHIVRLVEVANEPEGLPGQTHIDDVIEGDLPELDPDDVRGRLMVDGIIPLDDE